MTQRAVGEAIGLPASPRLGVISETLLLGWRCLALSTSPAQPRLIRVAAARSVMAQLPIR